MLVFLIGFMGSGKSHLGKELAKLMKYKFIDADKVIEKKARKKISKIFKTKGEAYFRELERKTLLKLTGEKKAVVATGGGMPCYFDNMKVMNENGITVYLEATEGFLFHRLIGDKANRPMISELTDIELMEFVMGTLGNRRAFYQQATIKVNAEKIKATQLKEKILKKNKQSI